MSISFLKFPFLVAGHFLTKQLFTGVRLLRSAERKNRKTVRLEDKKNLNVLMKTGWTVVFAEHLFLKTMKWNWGIFGVLFENISSLPNSYLEWLFQTVNSGEWAARKRSGVLSSEWTSVFNMYCNSIYRLIQCIPPCTFRSSRWPTVARWVINPCFIPANRRSSKVSLSWAWQRLASGSCAAPPRPLFLLSF